MRTPCGFPRFAGGVWSPGERPSNIPDTAIPAWLASTLDERLFLATTAPNGIFPLNPKDLSAGQSLNLTNTAGLTLPEGSPVSSAPGILIGGAFRRWLKTSATSGNPGLFFWQKGAWGWGAPNIVPYLEEITHSLSGIRLKLIDNTLWGLPTDTTPSSLYRMAPG